VRPEPRLAPPPVARAEREGWVEETYELELLTPLLGGGAEPQVNDPHFPVRGGSIRGQLRFWWRATRGGQFKNRDDLQKAENALWGSTEGPSQVVIQVKDQIFSKSVHINPPNHKGFPAIDDKLAPPYAAFPLMGKNNEIIPRYVIKDMKFKLVISYPEKFAPDVRAAMWAWTTIGGIGGRTRRGFGAVTLRNAQLLTATAWLDRFAGVLNEHVIGTHSQAGLPSLHGCNYVISRTSGTAIETWKDAVGKYSRFRQSRRKGSGPVPGRSFWPEPDAIRRLTRRRDSSHPDLLKIDKFPRAAFGLPIVFHFKSNSDPDDVEVFGEKGVADRLASPMIIRPVKVQNGYISLVIVLQNTYSSANELVPGGLRLNKAQGTPRIQHRLDPGEARTIRDQPNGVALTELEPDVLQSFLDYFAH